jgi:predicted nucleic-acid-binding Zn-ribbon protein
VATCPKCGCCEFYIREAGEVGDSASDRERKSANKQIRD